MVADAYGTPATPQIRTAHVVVPQPQYQAPEPEPQQEAEQESQQEPESNLPAIVRQYDADGSGVIEQDEWLAAVDDYANYRLTTPDI